MKKSMVVTGHTSGIGQRIYQHFVGLEFEVRGFSRSNGYDITDKDARTRLIQESLDYDIFINNAHAQWAQADLLFELFSFWRDQEKLIINIGSKSADGIKNFFHPYAISKKAVDEAATQLIHQKPCCRITTLKPSWVDTPAISAYGIRDQMLPVQDVANIVEWVVFQPAGIHIETMTFSARGPSNDLRR